LKNPERNKKPILVMLHGLGGTAMGFYRTIDLLRREFRIIAIDFMGMGASGRPPYRLKTARDS